MDKRKTQENAKESVTSRPSNRYCIVNFVTNGNICLQVIFVIVIVRAVFYTDCTSIWIAQ